MIYIYKQVPSIKPQLLQCKKPGLVFTSGYIKGALEGLRVVDNNFWNFKTHIQSAGPGFKNIQAHAEGNAACITPYVRKNSTVISILTLIMS